MTKKIYLFANWKMYLDYDESNILANALAKEAKNFPSQVKMAIFPSALALYPAGQALRDAGLAIGAQNVYWVEKGGYTGEISASMYKSAGCEYALVGHSERRHLFNETNHETRQKLEAILAGGLTPVICVGETLAERENGKTEEVMEIQIRSALQNLSWPKDRELIAAYEPVWAIGTGQNCDYLEAERMHNLLKKQIAALAGVDSVILYGGSVRPENVAEYLKSESIDGVLVGGASANLDSWMEIVRQVI